MLFNLAELVITDILDVNIAATAISGCSRPVNAIGIATTL